MGMMPKMEDCRHISCWNFYLTLRFVSSSFSLINRLRVALCTPKSRGKGTHDDAHRSSLPCPQALPDRNAREFNWMFHIDSNLLVSTFFLWILPKVRKVRIKHPSTDTVRIRHVVPLLFAFV